jgi:hypothetical protein
MNDEKDFYDYFLALANIGVIEAKTYGEQELWRGISRSLEKNVELKERFIRGCDQYHDWAKAIETLRTEVPAHPFLVSTENRKRALKNLGHP